MRLVTPLRIALAFLAALAAPASAQIVNGSFEPSSAMGNYAALPGGSTAIPGWVTTDTGVEWYKPAAFGDVAAPNGLYVVDLANYIFSAGGIQQTIPTVVGQAYVFQFFLGTNQQSGRDGTCEIVVSAAAQSQTFTHVNHATLTTWALQSFPFTATSTTTTLSLRCLQNANLHFALVDGGELLTPLSATPGTWGAIKRLYR